MPFGDLGTLGYWNAASNDKRLRSGMGRKGDAFIVSQAGNTLLDGIGSWAVNDLAYFSGDAWLRFPGNESLRRGKIIDVWDYLTEDEIASVSARDGIYDVSVACQAALNLATITGKAVYWPPGVYRCGSFLSGGGNNLTMFGCGMGVTSVVFSGFNGFYLTFTSIDQRLCIKDMSIQTILLNGGQGLVANWPQVISNLNHTLTMEDVEISGYSSVAYWTGGASFDFTWNGVVRGCLVRGAPNTRNMQYGMRFTGYGFGMNLSDNDVYFASRGYVVDNSVAGFTFRGNDAIYVNFGYDLNGTFATGSQIDGGNIESFEGGVVLANRPNSNIHGVRLAKHVESVAAWTGILAVTCDDSIYSDNHFNDNVGSLNSIGIDVHSSSRPHISNNTSYGINTAINVQPNCFDPIIVDNSRVGGTTTVSNLATGTMKVKGNNPSPGAVSLTFNTNIPSVRTTDDDFFLTNSSIPITITNFADGYDGQQIIVQAADNNTTLQYGGPINLIGTSDYTMPLNSIIVFRRRNGIWFELSRRVP